MGETIGDIRRRAWETRRRMYGPRGHAGSYSRLPEVSRDGLLALVIKLHVEGAVSEGQVARASGLHRIEIRRLADDLMNSPAAHHART